MYESRSTPLLPRLLFAWRLLAHMALAVSLMAGSLALGMLGYHHFEGLSWMDSFLNAAMILGGMGPVDAMKTEGGKLFAGLYALYAGLVFVGMAAIVLAPVFHRVMHRFHQEDDQ